jgi:3-O-acyltransferase
MDQVTARADHAAARPPEIRALTGFRWLIGLSLFVHHAVNFHMFAVLGPAWSPEDLTRGQQLMQQGSGAVAFFFLLSGFTLAWNYAHRFRSLEARAACRFWVNRIGSIWPVHLLAFGLALAFVLDDFLAAPLQLLTVAVPAVLLLQAWLPLAGPDTWTLGFNGPSWSLSALLFFYLCFPVLAALLVRLDRARPHLVVALPLAWVVATGAAAWAWAGDAYASWLFHTYPPVRLVDFVVGICTCLLLLRVVERHGSLGAAALPGGRAGATILEGCAVALVAAAVLGHAAVPLAVRYSAWYVLPLAVLVWTFARGGGLLSAAAGSRPLVQLGRIAFPFLILHVVVMQYLFKLGVYAQSPWLGTVSAFTISLALSIAVFRWWERPARRWVRARGGVWVDARFDAAARDDALDLQVARERGESTAPGRDEHAA